MKKCRFEKCGSYLPWTYREYNGPVIPERFLPHNEVAITAYTWGNTMYVDSRVYEG